MKETKRKIQLLNDGLDGTCYALSSSVDEIIYAGGEFTTAGKINAKNIARYNSVQNRWTALGEGVDDICKAIAVNPKNGDVYVGGQFIKAGNVEVNHVAKWTGRSWEALGAGLPDDCNAILIDENQNVYVGGNFTQIGDLTANYIAQWNPKTKSWSALGDGLPGACNALAFDGNGILYAGGEKAVSKWDNATNTWRILADNTVLSMSCHAIAIDSTSKIVYAGGNFGVVQYDEVNDGWINLPKIPDELILKGTCNALTLDKEGNLLITGNLRTGASPNESRICMVCYFGEDHYRQFNSNGTKDIQLKSSYGTGYTFCVDSEGVPYLGGSFPSMFGNIVKCIVLETENDRVGNPLLDAITLDMARLESFEDDGGIIIDAKDLGDDTVEVYRGKMHIGNLKSSSDIWGIPVKQGESITFRVIGKTNKVVSPSSISVSANSKKNEEYVISIITPFDSSDTKYVPIPNIKASESSFDIYKIPPARIDQAGAGIRRTIFKPLADETTRFTEQGVEKNVPLKPHFSLSEIRSSKGRQTTKSFYGLESIKQSLAASVEVAVPIKAISVEAKCGFSTEVESNISTQEVSTMSKIDGTEYTIDLVTEEIELADDFVADVQKLPVPTQKYSSIEEAKADAGWNSYRTTFIEKWGTHYPTQVTYGGYFLGIKTSSLKQIVKSNTNTISAEASISAAAITKAGASASNSNTKSSDTTNSQERVQFEQIGGTGNSFEDWQSDRKSASPIGINLSSLANLLTDDVFKGVINSDDLSKKQKMLELAFEDYDVSKPKYPATLPVREIYEIVPQSFKVLSADNDGKYFFGSDDTVEVMGKVNIKAGRCDKDGLNVAPVDVLSDLMTIWEVEQKNEVSFHHKNDVPKALQLKTTTPLRFVLEPGQSKSDFGFAIEIEKFWEHDTLGTDEVFTNVRMVRKLEDIAQGDADFTFTAKGKGNANHEKWTLEIATKVKRLTLKDIEIG